MKCPRCADISPTVELDNYGEPYVCQECWDEETELLSKEPLERIN